ncbi:MAG: VCBS repeat-containing protein, partial [Candidatus Krumholzibacteriota bacterium]|nr:VCBS repeat-containing protein [Candidatus Krumholzibacteriota bacterium]
DIDPSHYEQLKGRHIGPVGNRVSTVAGVVGDPMTYYGGAASGGVCVSTQRASRDSVVVSNSGGAVSGAMVCLSKGIDDYDVKTTNGSGVASFQFTAESPGSISIVVTAPNHAMYDGTILVSQPATAYVSYTDFLVDDDSLEGTSGNADGVMDAGETVDLIVFVTNAGDVPSGNITLRFRTNTSGVTITDSLTSVGVIPAAATLPAVDPFRVQFAPSLADEETVEFVLVVESGGMEISQDRIKKLVHAPELHPVVVRVDDITFGNGDGVIQNNEEILLFYKFKNFGTGATGGISVDIVDLDGGFVFIDSSDTYPDAVAGGLIENVAGFRMREPDTSTGHNLELTITDSYGRSYVEKFDLRGPDSPNNLTFDPSLGPDQLRVTWGASDSTDVEHYNVYRSSVPGGPYVLSNVDPVAHTVYVDRGLAATTRYYYVITAVDTSGNESGQSPEFSASTNPAQAEGWPISMPVETVSSPVIGDIDGDHDFEIVQGNDKLYAWHHDGVEIHDADLNAQTWGLFSTEGNSFVSHCALAPMDSIAGLEIIAASRDTKEVFVFNYTGATISGWPRPVENAIRAGLVAGDINGDGQKEVIAIDELGVLYVWLSSGAEYRDGDANPATQGVFRRFGGCTFQRGSPAIADIDNDGLNEIIIGTQCDSIFVLNEDGTSVPGWPVYIGPLGTSGSIAVGDIDGDGGNDLELVVHTWDGPVTAYHHDGSVLWTKWIRNYDTFPPSPALADFDDDGQLETVVAGSDGKLYVITSAGTNRPGWPVVYSSTTTTQSSPVVADINNDGSLDIILGDETQLINGWDSDGNTLPGFPLAVSDAVRATPTVADLDKDGDVDLIVAGWDKTVYVFDFPAMFNPQKIPWASFHANLYNDGNYSTPLPTPVIDASFQFVLGQGFVDLTWYLSADAGYLFHISRATMRGTEIGDFARVASNVAVTSDGLVRYADTTVKPGTRYIYRVESVDDATRAFTTPVVYVPITAAQLMQNYPNPFNPTTTIEYFVPDGAPRPVSLVVYDVRGSRVRTLVATHQAGGHYAVDWDGLNNKSRQVSSDSVNVANSSDEWLRRAFEEVWNQRPQPLDDVGLDKLKTFTASAWVQDQADYHQRAAHQNEQKHQRLSYAITALFGATLLMAVLHALASIVQSHHIKADRSTYRSWGDG